MYCTITNAVVHINQRAQVMYYAWRLSILGVYRYKHFFWERILIL